MKQLRDIYREHKRTEETEERERRETEENKTKKGTRRKKIGAFLPSLPFPRAR